MDKKVLVAYASKYGATKEIAERIGEVLRQKDLQADVFPVGGVRDLQAYEAVILGSAVYINKWPKEAEVFLQTHEKTLAERAVWLFSSGPTGEGDPLALVDGWLLPDTVKPVAERIHPRDITVFHGHINSEKVNFIEKMAIKNIVKKPFGDYRDWSTIVNWTTAIANTLMQAHSSTVRA